jgi:hypothetical protein
MKTIARSSIWWLCVLLLGVVMHADSGACTNVLAKGIFYENHRS